MQRPCNDRAQDVIVVFGRGRTMVTTRPVPGPSGSRLLGMAAELQRDQLRTYEAVTAQYGDVVRLSLGPPGLRRVIYLVTHPDGVERVFGGDGYTKETPYNREIAAYLGDGLLTSDGQRWRQQRRTVAPLFTHRRIAGYVDLMAEEAARVADRWRGRPSVDVSAEMVDYTLRAIGRILFGASVDDTVPVIQETFPVLNGHVRRRGLTPLRLPRSVPTAAQRRAARAQRRLYQVVDDIVERRRQAMADGVDLISRLLAARDPETGAPLTPQEVRDQVLIFLLAGHETTSTALTFTCHLLGRYPDVQRRLQEEIDAVLGGRAPVADDIGKLRYTSMVIKEAMRLYPPAYALGRISATGDRIAGYQIPPGSIVVLTPWATHRRPDLWPDPERFDPDRFEPAAEAARPRYAYLPFAGGLRGCIGSHFAMTEAVIAVATLLGAYTLRSEPGPVPLSTGITLRPAGPVSCRISPR
jgi:cytochrome P450